MVYEILEEREDAHQQVATRWNTLTNETELLLVDKSTGVSFCEVVEACRVHDAFVHPWCYVLPGSPVSAGPEPCAAPPRTAAQSSAETDPGEGPRPRSSR